MDALAAPAEVEPEPAEADPEPSEPGIEIVGRNPEMVELFRASQLRYQSRMEEFTSDVKVFLDDREFEERRALSECYDKLIDTLDDLERTRRVLTIEKFESFLERYPEVEYSSHVRFRLAELYYENDYEAWEEELAQYYRQADLAGDDLELLEELGDPPRKDFARSVALYERIIEDNRALPSENKYEHLDGAYYMLAYVLVEDTVQMDEDRAQAVLREMIEVLPDSAMADHSHLYIGLHHFNKNEVDEAIEQFTAVFEKGPTGKFFFEAMYQLAWSYYKLSEYDRALELFVGLLEQSDQDYQEKGKHSSFRGDAIKYMAISFVDMSDKDDMGRTPVQIAGDYFAQLDGDERSFEWEVFNELGSILVLYQRIPDAVDVYRKLQDDPRWRLRPENPEFQQTIARLQSSSMWADPEAAAEARKLLAERYHEGSEWWEANRHNPEATAQVRSFMERSLAEVAIDYRKKADALAVSGEASEAEVLASYAFAATKFQEYLDNFPISDDFYVMQWYLADTLYRSQDWTAAEREYMAIIRTDEQHQYGDGALVQLVQTRIAKMTAKYGDPTALPEGTPVAGTRVTEWGKEIPYYELTQDHVDFVRAIDQVLAHRFGVAGGEDTEIFQEWVNANRPGITYMAGQVYYNFGQYDEARRRLIPVIDRYRRTDDGSRAGALVVNTFNNEGDLASLRMWTSDFVRNPIGGDDTLDQMREQFANLEEGTAFKQAFVFVEQAQALEQRGEYEAGWPLRIQAAEGFLQFIQDFPESENKAVALYNAANNYQIVGKPDMAIELFERFVNIYPDDERSKGLYFRIAGNYESTFQLEKAIDYYERLVRLFPDHKDGSAAVYNAAFLRVGIGDHRGAAQAFERYAQKYPDKEDAEEVFFMAGAEWERVSETEAMRFYDRYLSKYGMDTDTAHAFAAMYRKAIINKEAGRTKQYNAQLDVIDQAYLKLLANGTPVGPLERHYAAEAGFRDLSSKYDTFMAIELKPNTMRNADDNAVLLLETLQNEVVTFDDEANAFASRYPDQEYVSATLYYKGMTMLKFSGMGIRLTCPTDMDEDTCWAWQELWDENALPKFETIENKGVGRLSTLVEKASAEGFHNEWITKALTALNEARPADWPAQKAEKFGETDSAVFPEIVPVYPPGMEPVGAGSSLAPPPGPAAQPDASDAKVQ
ncbi:MAG: tetratricopeptide repeat protein [Deltaproteobacteria bacterium]|nr:tetratricopeptide repeat protein [Deltaproteobacteria bacterium]